MIVTTTPTVEGNKLLRHGDYYKNIVTVQSQPRKLSFSRCGVSAKYIFTFKRSRKQAFITFKCKNMLSSEQLQNIS